MHVYEMNSVNQQFTKTKDIIVNGCKINQGGLFHNSLLFIKSKQLLVNKHGNCVNLIRKTQNEEFKVEQSQVFILISTKMWRQFLQKVHLLFLQYPPLWFFLIKYFYDLYFLPEK
ncbi:unnamed protein product [Paramecium pentaurelia]|uniref:Uncharacterized protein n=1 Tax=Paramecium pentaurelia TaxID=43138 RepID=A0A8S1WL25_9CILI|nr:unnamed protein product [Paramecium pentaurelia]